jgi:hypothetical protein
MIRILLLLGGIALGLAGAIAAPNLAAKLRGTLQRCPVSAGLRLNRRRQIQLVTMTITTITLWSSR